MHHAKVPILTWITVKVIRRREFCISRMAFLALPLVFNLNHVSAPTQLANVLYYRVNGCEKQNCPVFTHNANLTRVSSFSYFPYSGKVLALAKPKRRTSEKDHSIFKFNLDEPDQSYSLLYMQKRSSTQHSHPALSQQLGILAFHVYRTRIPKIARIETIRAHRHHILEENFLNCFVIVQLKKAYLGHYASTLHTIQTFFSFVFNKFNLVPASSAVK